MIALKPYSCVTGDLVIEETGLSALDLPYLTSVEGYLGILRNDSLTSLEGLSRLSSFGFNSPGPYPMDPGHFSSDLRPVIVKGEIEIGFNDALTSLEGLNGLTSVGALDINNNDSLTSLKGFNNIISVGGGSRYQRQHVPTPMRSLRPTRSTCRIFGGISIYDNKADTCNDGCSP